jgi:Bacterial dnaA protein helix-turn-helix
MEAQIMSYLERYTAERKARLRRLDPGLRPVVLPPQPDFPKEWLGRTADEINETRSQPTQVPYPFATERAQAITKFFQKLRNTGFTTIRQIQEAVSEAYKVPVVDILSARQHAHCVHARMVAMLLSKILSRASYPQIARHFGRHHSTIMHACKKKGMKELERKLREIRERDDPLWAWVNAAAAEAPLPELTPEALKKQGRDIAERMAERAAKRK